MVYLPTSLVLAPNFDASSVAVAAFPFLAAMAAGSPISTAIRIDAFWTGYIIVNS
jgi:hypothetical protein